MRCDTLSAATPDWKFAHPLRKNTQIQFPSTFSTGARTYQQQRTPFRLLGTDTWWNPPLQTMDYWTWNKTRTLRRWNPLETTRISSAAAYQFYGTRNNYYILNKQWSTEHHWRRVGVIDLSALPANVILFVLTVLTQKVARMLHRTNRWPTVVVSCYQANRLLRRWCIPRFQLPFLTLCKRLPPLRRDTGCRRLRLGSSRPRAWISAFSKSSVSRTMIISCKVQNNINY